MLSNYLRLKAPSFVKIVLYMASVEDLIRKNLKEGFMMVLATLSGDQPWAATVYFVADEQLNIYWVSTPERRHSQELASNFKAAGAIPLDANPSAPNVGVQVQGLAGLVAERLEVERAVKLYAQKFNSGDEYVENFLAGKDEHRLYKLAPSLLVLFDEKNFPGQARQEWHLA